MDKVNLTQFGQALRQLSIAMIPTYSPAARGRSERTNLFVDDTVNNGNNKGGKLGTVINLCSVEFSGVYPIPFEDSPEISR